MVYHDRKSAGGLPSMERFFEISSDLMCVVDITGRFLRLSRSWETQLGHSLESMQGQFFMDFVHPGDRDRTLEAMEHQLAGGEILDFTNRYRTAAGTWRTLSWRSSPSDENGLILAVARDVTEQQERAQRLAEETARLRAVMNTIPDLVFIKDAQFRYVGCNHPFEEFLGRTEQELLGNEDFQFFPREVAQFFRDHDIAMFQQGSARRNEEWVTYPDGRRLLLDTIKIPFRGEDGELLGLVGISRDITGQHEAARNLAEERARLQAMMDTMPDMVFIKDTTFRWVDCNRATETFLGRSRSELAGMVDFQLFGEKDAEFFREWDTRVFETGEPVRYEEWLHHPDGSGILVDMAKVPLRDSAGKLIGLLGIGRDITEQARLRSEVDLLGALVNRSRDPVCCMDPSDNFRLIYANNAACELFGAARPQVLGSPLSHFDTSLDPARQQSIRTMAASSAQPVIIHTDFTRPHADPLPVEMSVSRIHHEGREFLVAWLRDVSLRRAVERRLLEREALYRASIEATDDGFWLANSQGRILDANSAYATMSGYSIGELKSMCINDLEATESPADTQARIARIISTGSAIFETRHRRADGSEWDVEVKTIHSDVEGGRFFVFVHDLRRKHRADSLLKARLHLSEIGRSGDIDALMVEVLDTAERLTASRIGFFHFVDPDQKTLTLQAWSTNTVARMCKAEGKGMHYPIDEAGIWAECLRLGQPMVCNDYEAAQGKRGMPDGHAPVKRLLTVPVRGETGFTAVIGVGNKTEDYDPDDMDIVAELSTIAMDIVNWVRAENAQRHLSTALAETARHWTVAMDSFHDGIALLDGRHRLVRANSAFFNLTASEPSHRLGKVVHCLADIDERSHDCPVCEDLRLHDSRHFVLEAGDRGNPSGRPLEVRIIPILDETGRSEGVLLSLYDLSEVRAQEKRLEQTIAQLTRSRADLERFAQITAHDLQEPTRRQVLFAQLLRRQFRSGLDPDANSYIDQIVSDSFRMREMVHGLKTYFEAAQSAWAREEVDLDALCAGLEAAFAKELEHAEGRLAITPLGKVQGEPSRLQLLFSNLLSNAIKFRRPGLAPRIRISATEEAGTLTVAMADNGIGIPEEYRASIFTPFSRLSSESVRGSSGMGLAQCRQVVEDLGGRIWIEGNAEGGATVKFTLPR